MANRFVNGGLSELQDANRSPIFGYQHLPIVSLEQAMEKIIPIVPEVKEYVPLAKQNCNRDSSVLTWDESAAIYLYSMPVPFFTHLNEFLRAENRNALKPWFAFLKLFITALEKLPACEMIAWRGVASDVGSVFVQNDMQIWWSVNSCSKALNVVALYLGDTGTVFAVDAANGRDISEFSVFQEEQEVILMPGSRFRVKSNSLNFRDSLFIVHLEEESTSVRNKKDSSINRVRQSMNQRFNQDMDARHTASVSRMNKRFSRNSNIKSRSRYNADITESDQSNNVQASAVSSATNNADISLIWEPRAALYFERSVDLRCVVQKPFKARSLPKEMNYGKSEIMSANNEFLLLCGGGNLHLFDENLKLVRSTTETPISSYNLVDMVWCECIQRFIILSKEQVYVFDPVTTQLSSIESVRLQEKEYQYVSCTCSYDKLFIVTSESYGPSYLHHYSLPGFIFVCRLNVTNLIGPDPEWEENKQKYKWSRSSPEEDKREIISVRYNQQRLGVMMEIEMETYLYVLDLTEQPIRSTKTKLPWRGGQLVVLAKSGEWLIVRNGYNDKFIQIALDCQFKAECESKDYSQGSFFSFSTGFVNLKGNVINAIVFGSSYLVLLLDDSLALYNI